MRLLEYREYLQKHRKAQTVNGISSAINSFLEYCGWQECRVKFLNVQRPAFLDDTRELSETEYRRLLKTAYMERKCTSIYDNDDALQYRNSCE